MTKDTKEKTLRLLEDLTSEQLLKMAKELQQEKKRRSSKKKKKKK